MPNTIEHLNLQRYLAFITDCTDCHYGLAIYNAFGSKKKLAASEPLASIEKMLESVSNQHYNWDAITSNSSQGFQNKGYIHFIELNLGANEQRYWLLGIFKTTETLAEQQQTQHLKQLQHIANCVQEDYQQTESLQGMAEELTIRYEELNLLYGMDDADSFYKNQDEKQSLKQLLTNCIDFLDIDFSIIYLPELHISLHQYNKLNCKEAEILINRVVPQQIYPFMAKHPETLVINRNRESDWTDAGLLAPYKLIIVPIVKSNKHLHGILVLINALTKKDFSNSDRKLAEILAAEASKITQARRDPITGQLNRRGLTEKLEGLIKNQHAMVTPPCLLLINIDQFKVINDTAGQTGGDLLLKQVNSLIRKHLKKTDILGRLGADEFIAILIDCELKQAKNIAERIRIVIKQFRYFYQDKLFDISACVGLVQIGDDITEYSEAFRAADLACSLAKEEGRNRIHVFKKDDNNLLTHENQMQWVSRINIGLEENRFQIFRQRILPLQQEEALAHYEILLRLKDTNGEIISPFHFIPAAERYNLMTKLDQWVVTTTLMKLAHIKNTEPDDFFSCSINLSGQSFCEEGFSSFIIDQIKKSGLPPQHICFEITETAAVSNLTQTISFIEQIKAIGCQFSLDDFGSGMSSFTYLKNLPVDYLKIDGYFVKSMLENQIDRAMVKSIHQIGSVMGLKTIAEFVENDAIMERLKKMGVDYGQGYGIGKPQAF